MPREDFLHFTFVIPSMFTEILVVSLMVIFYGKRHLFYENIVSLTFNYSLEYSYAQVRSVFDIFQYYCMQLNKV